MSHLGFLSLLGMTIRNILDLILFEVFFWISVSQLRLDLLYNVINNRLEEGRKNKKRLRIFSATGSVSQYSNKSASFWLQVMFFCIRFILGFSALVDHKAFIVCFLSVYCKNQVGRATNKCLNNSSIHNSSQVFNILCDMVRSNSSYLCSFKVYGTTLLRHISGHNGKECWRTFAKVYQKWIFDG